jgi:hypothetical protein
MEGDVRNLLKILAWNVLGRAEENHETCQNPDETRTLHSIQCKHIKQETVTLVYPAY